MPLLREIHPDGVGLLREINEFRDFLATNPRSERTHFLPFFAAHLQLGAYLATLNDKVGAGTHVETEVSLWGDFTCDLVAGSLEDRAFVFVEFEDAAETSLFRRQEGRKNSHWGMRVEHAVSQVIDWLFRISSEGASDRMERDFGARHITPMGLVVVGRSAEVSDYDRNRLDWRSKHSIVGGARLAIVTYDDLLAWLDGRVTLLRSFTEAPGLST
jgi:hypothetical protein